MRETITIENETHMPWRTFRRKYEKGDLTILAMIDFSKAFLFLQKLEYYLGLVWF